MRHQQSPGKSTRSQFLLPTRRDEAEDRQSSIPFGSLIGLERATGTKLSNVRLHTGPYAASAAEAEGARAFAKGNDIVFGAGELDLNTPDGQHLLAHEVAHVVQQRGGTPTVARKRTRAPAARSDAELEADAFAEAFIAGHQTPTLSQQVPGIARKKRGRQSSEAASVSPAKKGLGVASLRLQTVAAVSERAYRRALETGVYKNADRKLVADLLTQVVAGTEKRDFEPLSKELDAAYVTSFRLTARYSGTKSNSKIVDRARARVRDHFESGGWLSPRLADLEERAPERSKAEVQQSASKHLALAATKLEAVTSTPGTGSEEADRAEMRRVAQEAALHVDIALEGFAAQGLTARQRRLELARVHAISASTGELEAWTRASKEKPHASYTALFDSEDRLLTSVGLDRKQRYVERTGNGGAIADSMADVKSKERKPRKKRSAYSNKSAALGAIESALGGVFRLQRQGVAQAKALVKEPPPEKVSTGWELLADLALSLAVTASAGVIGHGVKTFMRSWLVERGLGEALADAAKDSAKMLYKRGIKASIAAAGYKGGSLSVAASRTTDSRTPLNVFFGGQTFILQEAQVNAEDDFHRKELRHFDLRTLGLIAQSLRHFSSSPTVLLAQEQASVREWTNFIARISDPTLLKSPKNGRRDAAVRSADAKNAALSPDGFLTVTLDVDKHLGRTPAISLTGMEIGASSGVKRSLKASGLSVAKAGLNTLVRIRVNGDRNSIVLQRMPDSGRVTIGDSNLGGRAWLRAFQVGRSYKRGFSFLDTAELAYLHRTYDVGYALRAAKTLGAWVETQKLEAL